MSSLSNSISAFVTGCLCAYQYGTFRNDTTVSDLSYVFASEIVRDKLIGRAVAKHSEARVRERCVCARVCVLSYAISRFASCTSGELHVQTFGKGGM